MLVPPLAHPTVLVPCHAIVIADLSELVSVVYEYELLCNTGDLARIIAIAIDAVADIVSYFILYHFLLLFYHYEYSIAPLVKPVNLFR
jgi:hypothetical protein